MGKGFAGACPAPTSPSLVYSWCKTNTHSHFYSPLIPYMASYLVSTDPMRAQTRIGFTGTLTRELQHGQRGSQHERLAVLHHDCAHATCAFPSTRLLSSNSSISKLIFLFAGPQSSFSCRTLDDFCHTRFPLRAINLYCKPPFGLRLPLALCPTVI